MPLSNKYWVKPVVWPPAMVISIEIELRFSAKDHTPPACPRSEMQLALPGIRSPSSMVCEEGVLTPFSVTFSDHLRFSLAAFSRLRVHSGCSPLSSSCIRLVGGMWVAPWGAKSCRGDVQDKTTQ
ncbi:hypothetical protein TNCV_4894441 [Trichonephila clavipes]|nr:hypothetical protein TNCV_4894441 [Trichonephila clavipes]